MIKWGTYFILGAIATMVLPFILMYFRMEEIGSSPLFPLISIVFGGIGIFIHLTSAIKNKALGLSTLMLLISILSIIYGVSFQKLGIVNAEYLILAGVLLIAIWIMVPTQKKKD